MPIIATRGTVVPRFLFLALLSLTVAACGVRPSGTTTAAPEEPLDLVLRPAPDKPESSGPRRPVSADVVRKTAAEARALLGTPATLRREPPGEVWQYLAETPRCSLLLFLYPDESGSRVGRLRVTHAQVLSRTRGQTVDDSECLAALLKSPVPSIEPAPPSPTS